MDDAPNILRLCVNAGHTVFVNGPYNLNLIGVRSPSRIANVFDDRIHLVYRDDRGSWVDLCFRCTTDPGAYWLENPMRVDGTAILVPGQYRGAYRLGKHRNYPALVQARPVLVYRDANRNHILDMDAYQRGHFSINIHHAGEDSQRVDKWSAGCQVVANLAEWNILMAVVRRSAQTYGDTFTYTLLDQ